MVDSQRLTINIHLERASINNKLGIRQSETNVKKQRGEHLNNYRDQQTNSVHRQNKPGLSTMFRIH